MQNEHKDAQEKIQLENHKNAEKDFLTISELAKISGITQRIIHLHEERGFIKSIRSSKNANRYFKPEAVQRLHKVKQLQLIGLSLSEIGEVLPLYMDKSDHGVKGKEAALVILRNHLKEANEQLSQMQEFREDIIKSIARLEVLLEEYKKLNN